MSAALRVAHAAETIRARWERRVVESPQVEAAQALEDTGQLLDPEVAEELKRLRVERADRQDEVAAAVGYTSGLKWPDLVGIVASNTTSLVQAERDVRALRARIRELEAERHSTNESLSEAAEQLRVDRDRIAELESAAYGDAEVRLLAPVEQIRHLHQALAAQLARAGTLDRLLREAQAREAGPALPWAHTMPDDDLSGFLNDLVSAAVNRWQSDPEVPDRETLAAVEKACAEWRTPGQGYRSDEDEPAEVPPLLVFRASHESIVMGHYTSRQAAMDHVHTTLGNEEGGDVTARVIWRADDPEADEPTWECWLFDADMADDSPTGYVVTPLEVASAYDGEADE